MQPFLIYMSSFFTNCLASCVPPDSPSLIRACGTRGSLAAYEFFERIHSGDLVAVDWVDCGWMDPLDGYTLLLPFLFDTMRGLAWTMLR